MSLTQIIQRVVLSLFLLGLAVLLSCTGAAADAFKPDMAHNLVLPAHLVKPTYPSPATFQRRITSLYAPVVQKSPPFACAACGFPHTNPTVALMLLAVLVDLVVMASLIYGGGLLATLALN